MIHNLFLNLLPILEAVVDNQYTAQAAAYFGAAIAILTAGAAGLGQGMAAMKAVEAVGRQPEASGKITITMIAGQVMVETSGIYALIIALILSTK